MAETKYTNKESAFKSISIRPTNDGGLGLETWGQKTETGYSGGSRRITNELFTSNEIANGVAVNAELVRSRINDFLKTNPINTGLFDDSNHTFLKTGTPRYNRHLDAMTAQVQSLALERAGRNVYFHDYPDRAPLPISDETYKKSLLQMANLLSQNVASRGIFSTSSIGSRTDYDEVGIVDKQGLHSGFSLAELMKKHHGELIALGVSNPITAVTVVEVSPIARGDRSLNENDAAATVLANEPSPYNAHEARKLAKELRHNKEAIELVEAYLDEHGGKSKNDGKIGIRERGQFEKLLNAASNSEVEQIINKLGTIKINASQPDVDSPQLQVIADKSVRAPSAIRQV